jgi:hypothetical protein
MDTTKNPFLEVSLSHPLLGENDVENQMTPDVKEKKGKNFFIFRKWWKVRVKRSRTFDRLPVDLLRFVLEYYAKTFQEIIAFSCLSRTCKEVADYSSLWRTLKFHFYCPRKYLVATGENIQETESAEHYAERISSSYYGGGRLYFKEVLRPEWRFTPVFKVQIVDPLTHITAPTLRKVETPDLSHNHAFEIRNWFMEFFIAYQTLFAWHGKWRGTFNWMLNLEKKYAPYVKMYLSFISFSYLMLSCLVTFLFSNFDGHLLSIQNYFGFALLYFMLTTLLCFTLFSVLLVYCSKATSNYSSLVPVSLGLSDIMWLDQITIVLFTAVVSIFLVQLKLSNVIGTWVEVTIPLWIFVTLGTSLLCFSTKYLLWKAYQKILLVLFYGYAFYSICLTCSLTALHFDNNPLLKSTSVGYYVIPLYPIFLAAIALSFLKTFFTLRSYYHCCIEKRTLAMPFRGSSTCGDTVFLLLSSLGTLGALMMSFSIVMFCISCFMDNGENNSWDKGMFGIHFSPLVLVFLMVSSCLGFLTLFLFERSFSIERLMDYHPQ